MFIFRVLSYAVVISACLVSSILRAQVPQVKQLESDISSPLLVLPERGVDLRYFIEARDSVTIFWVANRGKSEVHFVPVWTMQDGRPWAEPEDRPNRPSPRIHISQHGRLYLVPPQGFKELILSEVCVGPDTGLFIDIKSELQQ